MTLDDVITKVSHWRDNLQQNAMHFRTFGPEAAASRAAARAQDMVDILSMLEDVKADAHKTTAIWELTPEEANRLARAAGQGRKVRVSVDWGDFKYKIGEGQWTPSVGERVK